MELLLGWIRGEDFGNIIETFELEGVADEITEDSAEI